MTFKTGSQAVSALMLFLREQNRGTQLTKGLERRRILPRLRSEAGGCVKGST